MTALEFCVYLCAFGAGTVVGAVIESRLGGKSEPKKPKDEIDDSFDGNFDFKPMPPVWIGIDREKFAAELMLRKAEVYSTAEFVELANACCKAADVIAEHRKSADAEREFYRKAREAGK